jgi:hypothetical protein
MFFEHRKQKNEEENTRKGGRRQMIFCFKVFEEMFLDPSNSDPKSFSFLIHFERFKEYGCID